MSSDLPAILFEPEGYAVDGHQVVGRQSAGHGFLRAAVQACAGGTLVACTALQRSAQAFAAAVGAMDPRVQARWLPTHDLRTLSQIGTLYVPDPGLARQARMRLRAGPGAYSLCGVTHTLSDHGPMDAIKHMLTAPVMPWDALVCTSHAAKSVVQGVIEAECDYLRWRLGGQVRLTVPQLPVIPLGVHAHDFDFSAAERDQAKAQLGIAPDETVLLYAGRLSMQSKAHPHAMFAAAEAVAQRSGQRPVLVLCGRFASEVAERAFRDGAAQRCPSVRCLFVPAQDEAQRRSAWAAGDVFISLADNLQESFGLTPLEAMACGMPVVVSDWNGYKDTVRDGLDGYRIPTWMAAPGAGEGWAGFLEAGGLDFDLYSALTAQAVAVDVHALIDRLLALVQSPARRQAMGQEARQRVRDRFDWTVVFARYRELWGELAALRRQAAVSPVQPAGLDTCEAPRVDAARQDPFHVFASYPTHALGPQSVLRWTPAVTTEQAWQTLLSPLYAFAVPADPVQRQRMTQALLCLQHGPLTVQAWAHACQAPVPDMVLLACQLTKAGVLLPPTPLAP